MLILFDLCPITFSHQSGQFIYGEMILKGWYESGIQNVKVLTSDIIVDMLRSKYPKYQYEVVSSRKNVGHRRWCLSMGWKRMKAINNSHCDLVFFPCPDQYGFFMPKIPQISVVHDLQYMSFGTKLQQKLLHWINVKSYRLIAITNFTKNELQKFQSGISSEKVVVIHNGVRYTNQRYERIISDNYILDVNMLYEYKNADTLVRAFGRIKDSYFGKLVLVGADCYNRWQELYDIAKSGGYEDRLIHLQNLPNEQLYSLYQNADLFVSPSTMEGFGQTPIEAAIYGTPVITSKCTALPESTLGLVNYYEPVLSEVALADVMIRVLRNPPSKKEQVAISEKFKKEYDVVGQSLKVYDFLMNCGLR